MIRGLLITNRFLRTDKFVEHYAWLSAAAKAQGMSLDLWDNATFPIRYGEQVRQDLKERMKPYRFILYWDKDVRFGKYLMMVCGQMQIPVYNSVESMEACDDKSETYRILQLWNDGRRTEWEQIPLLPTVVAPMTYPGVGYTNLDFLDKVLEQLGLPLVIKACFGSFGQQVWLVDGEKELRSRTEQLAGVPFLYQEYLKKSHGHDVRMQVVGNQVVAAMHRFSETGDFRANLSNGARMEAYIPVKAERELALRTVQALGLDFAGVDLLFSHGPGTPADVVCEVNSNAHFRNISDCTGVNVAEKIMAYIAQKC